MKTKTVTLTPQVRETLLRSTIDGVKLFLPAQLPRAEYLAVAEAIKAAGGKWDRKSGAHIFPQDVRKTLNISGDSVEVVNVQQTYQQFFTPPEIADRVVELAGINGTHRILEPSAGRGALVEAVERALPNRGKHVLCVELDELNYPSLQKLGVLIAMPRDFMDHDPRGGRRFDRILMNPPFTGGQDVKHVKHAIKFLDTMGMLVGICACGPKQQEQIKPMCAHWEELGPGAFKSSGTNVNTAMFCICA